MLTWRPPNGESVVDVMKRAREFIRLVQEEAMGLPVENPTVVVVSHSIFMKWLDYIISTQEGFSQTVARPSLAAPGQGLIQNTGILQYTFTYVRDGVGGGWQLEGVSCDKRGCAAHLEGQDGGYQTCTGTCCGHQTGE